jgi:hypothetical protein
VFATKNDATVHKMFMGDGYGSPSSYNYEEYDEYEYDNMNTKELASAIASQIYQEMPIHHKIMANR